MVFLLEELSYARNNPSFFQDRVILIFRNNIVVEFNKSLLIKLSEEVYTYNSIDNIDINKDKTDYILQEFLQSQTPSKLLLTRLNLKVGAPIILFCNLYFALEEYNKTRMIIILT